MRTWAWTLGLLLLTGGCTEARVGTETGNPPAVSLGQLDVEAAGDDMVTVSGDAGAVSPGGGEVSVRNVSQGGEPVTTSVDEDGSFEVTLDGTLADEYEVVASNDAGDSSPKTLRKDSTPPPAGDWQTLHQCRDDDPMASITISEAMVAGDELFLTVHHGGGCEKHRYGLCYAREWAESYPIQVGFTVLHDDGGDDCDAWLTESVSFDLTPFKDAYRDAYLSDEGAVQMGFRNCETDGGNGGCSVLYEWPVVTSNGPSRIRMRNVSAYDYENLIVAGQKFGSLAAGETTGYRDFDTAYRYANVELEIDGKPYVFQPIDFVGETPLGPDYFTYELLVTDLDSGFVNIELVVDSDD